MPAADPSPEVDEVLSTMPGWAARGMLYTIGAFVIALLVWAHFSVRDIVVSGRGSIENGKVIMTVRNEDIGQIETRQPAQLEIDAYPYQHCGAVEAKVASIERAGPDYKATLDPQRNTIHCRGRDHHLRDGLSLTANIVTGHETLLDVLLSPFRKPESAN